MSATITTPTIEDAVNAAFDKRPAEWIQSPGFALNDAIGNWVLAVQEQFWPRHNCPGGCDSDSSCPGAPRWERDLADEYAYATHAIEESAIALARIQLRIMVERFTEHHPEAISPR
jgi:hypothetical protein